METLWKSSKYFFRSGKSIEDTFNASGRLNNKKVWGRGKGQTNRPFGLLKINCPSRTGTLQPNSNYGREGGKARKVKHMFMIMCSCRVLQCRLTQNYSKLPPPQR